MKVHGEETFKPSQCVRSCNCVASGNCLDMRFFSWASVVDRHSHTYELFFLLSRQFPTYNPVIVTVLLVFHCMFMHLTISCLEMEYPHLHFINRFAIESHKHGNDEQNTQHFQQNGSLEQLE